MFKHFILIGLAIASFTLENHVVEAASDLAPPPTNQMSRAAYQAQDALVLHATNPRYAMESAIVTVQKAFATTHKAIRPVLY